MEKLRKSSECKSSMGQKKIKFTNQQMLSLITMTQKLLNQNRTLYKNILDYDPYFNYNLYKPKRQSGVTNEVQKQFRLKQIDMLLDQQSFLSQKKQQLIFRNEFPIQRQTCNTLNLKNQFTFSDIKSLFNSLPAPYSVSSERRVQQLSNIVGKIKDKIDKQIIVQKVQMKKNKFFNDNIFFTEKEFSKIQYQNRQLKSQLKCLYQKNKNLIQTAQLQQKSSIEKKKREQNLLQRIRSLEQQIKLTQNKLQVITKQLQQKDKSIAQYAKCLYHFVNSSEKYSIKIFSQLHHQSNTINTQRSMTEILDYLKTQTIKIGNNNQEYQLQNQSNIKVNYEQIMKKVKSQKNLRNIENPCKPNIKLHGIRWIESLEKIYIQPINNQNKCFNSNSENFSEKTMPENESELTIGSNQKFKRSQKRHRYSNTHNFYSEFSENNNRIIIE